jgi:glucose/arabinose dehydrogenase
MVCAGPHDDARTQPTQSSSHGSLIGAQEVAKGLSNPVYLTTPTGDPRLFIVEQPGRIRIVENGKLISKPFLDITDKVGFGGERGLLSVAFHPLYRSNGFLFVDYTDKHGDTRIERYTVSSDPNAVDPATAKLILAIDQPYANHNGGLVMFGPDGMLYIGMGDGGSQRDPHGNGQNPNVLLGKLLRINIDRGDPYSIPSANPYAKGGGRGEIWALGLRNPWRFAFDKPSGMLFIADVGQDKYEEINVAPANTPGVNYGWSEMDGPDCFKSPACNKNLFQKPAFTYTHDGGLCSIIGGSVYRGRAIPELVGHFLYSDYCDSGVRSVHIENNRVAEPQQWIDGGLGNIVSFGEDSRGELYICSSNGRVYRIIKT